LRTQRSASMSIAIVDARGWQNTLDLKTGEKISSSRPVVEMVKGVLQRHPYPGDMDPKSNRWVSDMALDLVDSYGPRHVFLTYAAQYFSGRYMPMTSQMRADMISDAFVEAQRFISASGMEAMVVGTGGMTPLKGTIDLSRLDGLAICTHWANRYAGLYEPSARDMELLRRHPRIEKIIARKEVAALFNADARQAQRIPEYLMLAREGYAFKTMSGASKMPVMIPSLNFLVPVHAPGHPPEAITGIRKTLEQSLAKKNIALIIMEGVGHDEFPWPCAPCTNNADWYFYEPGGTQLLTIASGRHRFLDYPTGYKYFDEEKEAMDYPFSGYFNSIPQGTFAGEFAGKSIAVGNRSMFMHMVTGADISVECFARNLYNQGTMAVIHREDKW